jgi:uncharacterized repeat protein (TIGR01451 family)/fimbrial isopeptide formation D2 family protein
MPVRRVRRWPIAVVAALLLSPVLAVFLNAPAVRADETDPRPTASLPLPFDALIGSTVSFDVSFVNDGPMTGYGPYVDLTLPLGHDGNDGLTFVSATYLGASITPVQKTAGPDGTVLHPYAVDPFGAPVVIHGLVPGQSYVVLRLPFGSFTPGQPPAVLHVTTQMSDHANVGWPLDVIADGGFQFGRTAVSDPTSGDPSILQVTAATTHVTPTIILVSKTYNGPEHETATGRDFPESYTITATIAKDQPVTGLILSDTLPDNMQYLSTDATAKPSSAVETPDTGIPGGVVSRDFGPVTGTGGEDASFTFHFYIPRLDAAHADILPPHTGAFADSVDTARADANWLPVDLNDRLPDNALTPISAGPVSDTLRDKSVAIQKHVSLLTDLGAPGASPGDTLEWTMQVQVSDYFALQNVVVYDKLGDGTIWDGIAPTMSVAGNNFTSGQAVMTNYSHVDPDADGITAFEFRISDELISRGQETGRLIGGCIDPVYGTAAPNCTGDHTPVTATITFKSVIQQTYIKAGRGQVVEGDTLGNLASVTGDVLSTTAPFDPTASSIGDGSYAVASAGTSASITIERGELEKTIYAINGEPVPEGPVHVSPGDSITYELKQHFPTSRTDDFRMIDYLPLPIFDAADLSTPPTHFDSAFDAHWALDPANLDYIRDPAPTAGTAKYGPGDTFHALNTVDSGPAPTPTISDATPSSTSANSVEFHYGNYALYPPAPSVADVLFTVTVSDKPFADGLLFTNQARSETKNAAGDLQTADAIIQITLDQPVLAITKGVVATSRTNAIFSPAAVGPVDFSVPPGPSCAAWTGGSITSAGLAATPIKSDLDGVDAGDLVRFAIVVENTGHADAFKVQVSDSLHEGFVVPTGGLDLCANDGAGNPISTTDLSGGLFGSGIQLVDGSDGAVARGVSGSTPNTAGTNIAVITYTLQVAGSIEPDTTVTNVASLLDYADGPDADGHLATPLTDDATVHTTLPSATKEVSGESLAGTQRYAVGEIVDYRVTLTIPEGVLPGATVTDTLPAGMALVDCVSIRALSAGEITTDLTTSLAGGFSHACSAGTNPAVSNGVLDVAFSLGNISNANRLDGAAETLEINYRAVVLNAATNIRGHTMTNSATLTWDGSALDPVSSEAISVAEPWITVTKTPDKLTADAGDKVTYTVTVTNDGPDDSDAYEAAWSDKIPGGMIYFSTPPSLAYISGDVPTSLGISGTDITATWLDLPAGHSTTFKYAVTVGDDAVPEHVFHNVEAVAWSSLPGSDPNERTGNTSDPGGTLNKYSNTAFADVDVPAAAVVKAVTSTSMAGTQGYAVGEIVTYRVTVTIPEGQLPGATITDHLPVGMALVDCVSIRALQDGLPSGVLTTSLTTGFGDACHAGSNPSVANAGQDVVFTLGDITNSDRDNAKTETLEINYSVVVLNVVGAGHDNIRGHQLTNSATLDWTGATAPVTATAPTVHVVEPIMRVLKTVDKTTGDAGDEFTFTVVITNPTDANGSKGFEATWTDTLPTGLNYESGLAATTCDIAPTTLTATGNNLLAIWPIFNAGDSCTLTYKAILADDVPSGASYQNSAALTWTSLSGVHSTLPGFSSFNSDLSTERTGNLSDPGTTANTYLWTSSVTVHVTQPAPVKSFVSTSEAGTSDTGLTVATNTLVEIGEIVRYRVAVTIPEGVTPNVSIKDTLPAGLQYLNDNTTKVAFVTNDLGHARMTSSTLNSDPQVTGDATWALHPTYVLPSGSISVVGNTPKFDLGDITNNDRDDDKEEIVVEFNVLALNVTGNKSAGPPTVLTDKASLWTGSPTQTWQIDSNQLTETIAEPVIVDTANFDKTVSPGNGVNDAGDTVTYTITIANVGNAPAYDYHLTDTLPANLESPPTNIGVVCGSGTYDKSASAGAVVDVTMTEIDPTRSCVVTVAAKVGATEQANTLFRNTADGTYTSLPGDHGTDAAHGNDTGSTTPGDPASGTGERTGLPADALNHYVNTKYVDLTLKAPSIVKNIPTLASAPIGAQTTFDLVVTVPEGKTRGLSVTDTLPWGLKPITATVIQLAADSGYPVGNYRLAADFSGALGIVSETATPTDQTHRLWTWTFAGDGNNDVVVPATNTPNDDKFLIRITAQVDNVLVNRAGDHLDNSAVVTYTNPQTGNPANVGSATRTVTVYEPDLTVVKTVSNSTPHFGDPVTYTLTIKHTAGATDDITAYDVSLVDAIPAGMAYVADSLSQTANLAPAPTTWGYGGGNITMTWDSFPLGGPDTVFTYQATVNGPSPLKIGDPITNTATTTWTSLPGDQAPSERTGADGIGAGFLNNYRVAPTQTVTVTGADMTIGKDDNQATAAAADVLGYVVHYQNDGNQAASNVVIYETVPAGTTFYTASSTGTWIGCSNGSIAGTACHLNIASVAAHGSAGDSGNYTFAVKVVDPIASTRVTIDNTATIADDGTHGVDPTDNNSVTHTDTTQTADLSLTKTSDVARPNANQIVHFTLTLTNAGPDPATNVVVHDLLPSGMSYVSDDSSGAYNHNTGTWNIGGMGSSGPTATKTLVITARATSVQVSGGLPQPIVNVAEVSHSGQRDPDSTPNNGITSEDDYATASVTPTLADMAVTKTVDHANPNVGDDVIFTITATNNGPDIATNAKVVDPLPSGLTWVSSTPSVGTWSGSTWTIGDLAVGASATMALKAHVDTSGTKTNTATVSADPFDPTPPNNNSASRSVTPQQADLAVGKTVNNLSPEIGETVTFTVTVNNNIGPDTATNVTLTDLLPGGLTWVSDSGNGYDHNTGLWTVGTLIKNAGATLTIHATVNSSGTITNTASVWHSDQYDPVSTNNTAHVDLASRTVDVGVAKTVDHAAPHVGDTIHYTLTVTNHSLVYGVTLLKVTDLLPEGVSYVSDAGGGAYNSTTGVWDIGTLALNTSVTKTITVLVTASGRIDNTLSFTSMLQTDTNSDNNTATVPIDVPLAADIAITKTVDNNRPNVGGNVTFTVTATNNGPDNATGVRIGDAFPAGLTLVPPTPSDPTTYSSGTWDIGNLDKGASATLTLTASVDAAGLRTNTASVSHSDQTDPVPGNNSASASVDQRVDLTVSKSVDHPTANVGATETFTIGVSNAGPNTAHNVKIADLLPAGLTYISDDAVGLNTYVSTTGVWTIDSIASGGSATLHIQATLGAPGPDTYTGLVTNTATVQSANETQSANHGPAHATVTPPEADLEVTKTVSNAKPDVGEEVVYTIALKNLGPNDATGVLLHDLLPDNMTYVSDDGAIAYDHVTSHDWTVGDLASGATVTLHIHATVDAHGDYTNTAAVTHSDQYDPVTTNNTDDAFLTTRKADVGVEKTVNHANPNVGDTVEYTITATNHGLDPATQIVINDLLPAGVVYVSDDGAGKYNPTTGDWAVGSLGFDASGPLQSATLHIDARVVNSGITINKATVKSLLQRDDNDGNDSATAQIDAPKAADLSLAKTVDHATPDKGATVVFTVTVTNSGPDDTTEVVVHDAWPDGLTFVSDDGGGAYDSATGNWSVGNLNVGDHASLKITATVDVESQITNIAEVTHSHLYDPDSTPGNGVAGEDDRATVIVNAHGVADLEVTKAVAPKSVFTGDRVTYTIVVTNHGPDNATGVIVRDQLPDGVTYVSSAGGTYSAKTGAWTVGSLTTHSSASLTITATVGKNASITNNAGVAASDQRDPDLSNNADSAAIKSVPHLPRTAANGPAAPDGGSGPLTIWLLGLAFAVLALTASGALAIRNRRIKARL